MEYWKRLLATALAMLTLCTCMNPGLLQVNADTLEVLEEDSVLLPGEMPAMAADIFTQLPADTAGIPGNDALYEGYLYRLFYGGEAMPIGDLARNSLNKRGKRLYDYLKENILLVASGKSSSTEFPITYQQIIDWSGAGVYTGSSAKNAFQQFSQEFQIDMVIDALLNDCPYDLYWFDKVNGVFMPYSYSSSSAGYKLHTVKFQFYVVADHQSSGSSITVNASRVNTAAAAAANAKKVVTQNAKASDYEKLLAYKKEICSLVSYNSSVAPSSFSTDADPWQLIYVFDGNTSTNVVCEGYSKAFQYLCDLSSFEGTVNCYSVTGDLVGAGGHMWNIVTIGGKNYLADITNSDSNTVGSDGHLFLAGGSGSIASGYNISTSKFVYDTDMKTLWGTGADSILLLSSSGYNPYADPCANGHSWKAATCLAPKHCSACGITEGSAGDHTKVTDKAEDATCTKPGKTEGSHCSVCGKTFVAQTSIPATGHSPVTDAAKAATCTASGLTEGSHCSVCDLVLVTQKTVPATGHTKAVDPAKAATCTETGLTEGSHCSVCELVLVAQKTVAALGHTPVTDPGKAATCTEDGITEGSHCSVCSMVLVEQTVIPAAGEHTYQNGVCSLCGDTLPTPPDPTDPSEPHTHSYTLKNLDDAYRKSAATCTEAAVYYRSCICGEKGTEVFTHGEAAGHQEVTDEAKAPTCTEAGLTEGAHCSVCLAVIVPQTAVPALGKHQYEDGVCHFCGAITPVNAPEASIVSKTASGLPHVSWEKVEDAVSYQIYRAAGTSKDYTLLSSIIASSYTDATAEAGIRYTYKIVAQDADGNISACSNAVSRTCDLPQPVIRIGNSSSSGKITVSWDAIPGAKEYKVYRATSKTGSFKLMKTVPGTTYTNTSAAAGKTYYYKVRAIHSNSAANSAYSSVKYRTCDLPQPSISLKSIASSGKIQVSWKAIEGAVSYKVYRATSKNGTYKLMKTTSGTSYTNTSVNPGTTYYYKVKAIHEKEAASSAYSSYKYRTCDLPRPDVEIHLKNGNPRLTWDKIDGAVEYKVYRATSKNGSYKLMSTRTSASYTNTSAKAGTTYYYKVKAIHEKEAANSPYSTIVSIKAK